MIEHSLYFLNYGKMLWAAGFEKAIWKTVLTAKKFIKECTVIVGRKQLSLYLCSNYEKRKQMQTYGVALVDGKGAQRVTKVIRSIL